jgi:autotransporter-associated beta strand protein
LILSGNSTLRVTGESYTDRGLTLNSGTNTIEVFNAADQVTIAGQIVGGGALLKAGAGALALTVSNGYTGGTFISGGSVSLGSVAGNQYGLGSGLVTISNATVNLMDVEASENCAWGIRVPTNSTATLNCDGRSTMSGSLTGGGTLNVFSPYVRTDFSGNWSAFTGQINATGGNFRENNSAGYPLAKFYVGSAASLQNRVSGTPTISIGELSGDQGGNCSASGGNDGVAVNWSVGGLNTSATFAGNTYNGIGFIKVGTGAWIWTGTNISHTGQTTVNVGTLLINGNAAPASGAVTVGASGTLGGTGVVGGATTVNGKLSPGSNGIGTLTFSNNVTLASGSTVFIEINKGAATKDLVNASGTVVYGGTLLVTNLGGTLINGDSFKIFNAATYGGTFASFNLPPLTNSLVWDKTALASSGTLSVIISNGVTGPKTLVWKGDGAANAWDVNATANWLDAGNAAAYFTNGDLVIFNDTGSNNVPVALNTSISPGSFCINATKDFVLSGSGAINGTNGLVKSGGGTFTLMTTNGYTGATTITEGTLRLLGLGSGLAHRWSFNNSLADSVGGGTAVIVDVGASNVTQSANSVSLAGGARTSADYVSLGANLLPNTTAPVTIEIWATQNAVQNWARIFDFGASSTENLLMSWTMGTTLASDRVEWKDGSTSTTDNSNQPYTLGTEFHIALVIEPGAGAGGTTRVTWYRAASTNSALGAARGTFNSTNTLVSFVNTNCWLGRSEYTGDNTASATYNEVRIWNRALSATDLQNLHTNGPDAGLNAALPATTAVNLSGGSAVLDLQNGTTQTIGSLAGADGAELKLTTSSLIADGNNASTTFAGFISGTNNFTKTGGGTLELSGASTATGGTILSNGTLLVNGSIAGMLTAKGGKLGGSGGIGGAATINFGATLAPGNAIGTLTFSNSLTLASGSTNVFEISSAPATNDAAIVLGALVNGGTLIVTNIGGTAPAPGDSFKLFDAASYAGSFAVVSLPALNSGLAWNKAALATAGVITVVSNTPPGIGSIKFTGSTFVFSGSNGVPGNPYYVIATTNLALPLTNWTRLATNVFDTGGNFGWTNSFNAGASQFFYSLLVP